MLDEIATDEYNSNVRELQAFLYILMRDHLPSGEVHGILINNTSVRKKGTGWVYSNPFLAADALKVAEAILGHCTFQDALRPGGQVGSGELVTIHKTQLLQAEVQAYTQVERANDPIGW